MDKSNIKSSYQSDWFSQLLSIGRFAIESWEKQLNFLLLPKAKKDSILCRDKCSHCCFTMKVCTLSEAMLIIDYMTTHFSLKEQERLRLRVESNTSTLKKWRNLGLCESDRKFSEAGGMECPFLKDSSCSIYPVRPISCRSQIALKGFNTNLCRQQPNNITPSRIKNKALTFRKLIQAKEIVSCFSEKLKANFSSLMISEALSHLWKQGASYTTNRIPQKAIKMRLSSQNTFKDQSWQDDRFDLKILDLPLVIPEEGEYPPNLLILKTKPQINDIYGDFVSIDKQPEMVSLHKIHSGSFFNWVKRKFICKPENTTNIGHTLWMTDSMQERLMMWEAAKRSHGNVLCAGLGLGIFPQYTVSLPQIKSVLIVEKNLGNIQLIKNTWKATPFENLDKISIVHSTIEDYISQTKKKFDTIFFDTWDALFLEYLPHCNFLTDISLGILNENGEILHWGYDLMVRDFLKQAEIIFSLKESFLSLTINEISRMSVAFPLFRNLLIWLTKNPNCSKDDLLQKAYQLGTEQSQNLGILKLSESMGGKKVLERKYKNKKKIENSFLPPNG